jgi:protein gp37
MGENSGVSWTDDTFNPWWGCSKISPACTHCYAETWAARMGWTGIWAPNPLQRRTFGEKHWKEPLAWNARAGREGMPRKVFCGSMCDIFEDLPSHVPGIAQARAQLYGLVEVTDWLTWLFLSKRIHNACQMLPASWMEKPRENVWLGTTVETQAYALERIPALLATPAVKRWLSVEPLLGPVNLFGSLECPGPGALVDGATYPTDYGTGHESDAWLVPQIDWVIVGGESGKQARPMKPAWVRSLRDECRAHGVPFFFKQWGHWIPVEQANLAQTIKNSQKFGDEWFIEAPNLDWEHGHTLAARLVDGVEWRDIPEVGAPA